MTNLPSDKAPAADVMRKHDNVTRGGAAVEVRVDGTGQFDVEYEEIAEALGWADFGNDDFELRPIG